VKIQPITHKTLAEAVAGKLAGSLLDGSLQPGTQLPPERELITKFGISRSTLREALKVLENHRLVEARPNVGWFAREIDESNLTEAKELSGSSNQAERQTRSEPPTGPIRLPIAMEKPLHIPNLSKDRLGTFDFISWWDRD
jgi:DNA-binding FadR family transcriptional regulator